MGPELSVVVPCEEQDTRGNSCLQLSAKQKKTHVDGGQGAAPARANASARVVAITYCDAGFASIWPTFIKCYERALGCSLDARNDDCGPSKPKLLDLPLMMLVLPIVQMPYPHHDMTCIVLL